MKAMKVMKTSKMAMKAKPDLLAGPSGCGRCRWNLSGCLGCSPARHLRRQHADVMGGLEAKSLAELGSYDPLDL
eukprot:4110835-Heterocapsa_arctica.AAC.1